MRIRRALLVVAVGASLTACSSSTSPPGPTSGGPTASPPATTAAAPPSLSGITVTDAVLTVTGTTGMLSATIRNGTPNHVILRAISCANAGMVQLGAPRAGSTDLAPVPDGVPMPAAATATIGKDVVVRLVGLAPTVTKGSTVTVTAYFGAAGTADFQATVR